MRSWHVVLPSEPIGVGINVRLHPLSTEAWQFSFPNTQEDVAGWSDDHRQASNLRLVPWQDVHACMSKRELAATQTASLWSLFCVAESARLCVCVSVCEWARRACHYYFECAVERAHAYAACLHGHRGSDDVFKVARQLGDGALGEC